MNKTIIQTTNAPAAIGPYSQAVKGDNILFISGQLPIDPNTSKMIEGSIGKKTEQILTNMKAILSEAGITLDHIVKTTIFLTDLNDFSAVNEAYGLFFRENPPARSTVQVAALPLGSEIEIEAMAILG